MRKYFLAILLAMALCATQLGSVAADKSTPPAAIDWDGSTPMRQGRSWRNTGGPTPSSEPSTLTLGRR